MMTLEGLIIYFQYIIYNLTCIYYHRQIYACIYTFTLSMIYMLSNNMNDYNIWSMSVSHNPQEAPLHTQLYPRPALPLLHLPSRTHLYQGCSSVLKWRQFSLSHLYGTFCFCPNKERERGHMLCCDLLTWHI